ncbi:MAG: hypothetical protein HY549_00720 [Elusimicrobia bacterium]|nr:hypothetical protein [Elusimicrobiota bacterium]
MIDEAAYYRRLKRSIDDSLAHELAHFIQVRYRGARLEQDPMLEEEAIHVQVWFRETFVPDGADSPCRLKRIE